MNSAPFITNFACAGKLTRFLLRRERLLSIIWLMLMLLFVVGLASGLESMFEPDARQALGETLKNPVMVSMMGPVYGSDNYTMGAMFSNFMLLWAVIAAAVMNIFLVVRHTRADEEQGREEVLRSLPSGRLAKLSAAFIIAIIINTILAVFTGIGIAILGVESMNLTGSLVFGAAVGAAGLCFAAVTAVFSQLSASSRGATALSLATLGIFYVMRGMGDVSSEALSLVSPLGLVLRTQAYVGNYLWPILTLLLESVVFAAIALMLNTARDLGQGFIPAKPGRSEASFALRSPLGLAFRLLRNTMVAWLVTIFLLGASYGSVLGDFDDFINTSEFYQMMIGVNPNFSLVEMFATMVSSMMALVSVIPLIAAASKPWGEEKDNRAEHMLARVVSRWRYLSGYVVITYVFSVCLQLATPFGLYLSSMAVLAEPLPLDILLKSNLAYLPALWVIIGLTVLLAGLLPKVSGFIWVFYGYTFFVTFIGRALVIPDVFKAFTPFTYIPQYPIDDITAAPMVIMTVIAAVLTTAGFIFYRRRDVITAA